MKRIVKYVTLAAVAAATVSCAGKGDKTASEAEMTAAPVEIVPNVTVTEAVTRDVPMEEVYASTVQAYAINNIVPQSGARIRKINVEIGDFVQKGQVLAEMDRLNLEQSGLKLANDSTELSRLKSLFDEGGISQSDYEAAELAYKVSKASYDNLVENTVLRSPLNGVVTARNYDVGDMYAMASPIFVVQQIVPVKLLVGISESDYTKVKKGDTVDIEADAVPGQSFQGKVGRIYPTMDAATHTFQAEVLVNNYNRVLRPGMYARVKVSFGVSHSIVVPDQAVVKQQGSGQRGVFVLQEDGTAAYVIVEQGRHIGNEYEILSGLNEGDRIIVKGASTLKNGAKVNVID